MKISTFYVHIMEAAQQEGITIDEALIETKRFIKKEKDHGLYSKEQEKRTVF